MEYQVNPDGEIIIPKLVSLSRQEMEFIAKSREYGLTWNHIGIYFDKSGEAIRSCWRRALSRFDDLVDKDNCNNLILLSKRFWSKVNFNNGWMASCWEWTAAKNKDGYGKFRIGQTSIIASKMAYLLTKGNVPEGKVVMHLCHNKACCNPSHLELGTKSENGKHKNEEIINTGNIDDGVAGAYPWQG